MSTSPHLHSADDGPEPFDDPRATDCWIAECGRWRVVNAARTLHETLAEANRWQRVCANLTEAFGLAVWRERHPLDAEKLEQRRLWRRRAKFERQFLAEALAKWIPLKGDA